jgi:isoleucyl-tRNA synthetase
MFKSVSSKVDFVAQEHEIQDYWTSNDTFRKLWVQNKGKAKWSFIDGPITANNPMGVHHGWGRTYKDLWNRFWAMRGREMRYQQGFDCQGLWVEVEVEKELNFKSKRDIETFGVADFVNLCKARVLKYAGVQSEQSIRLGYWMDWNDPAVLQDLSEKMVKDPWQCVTVNGPQGPVTGTVDSIVARLGTPELGGSYFTFSDENNYTIWAMLRKCYDRGMVYKGTDVMPWCPRCSTGLSEHEIAGEGYEERVHTSVFLRFPLVDRPGESLLVWTTTPWTLSSNVAAAVHPDLVYQLVQVGENRMWLAKGAVAGAIGGAPVVLEERQGKDLLGWSYRGPFDELPAVMNAGVVHRVIAWKDVGEAEGSGIVHIAPGCGKEDYVLGKENCLAVVAPIDEYGVFVDGFAWLTGLGAAEAAPRIFADLEQKGILFKLQRFSHRYPICWRCKSELVFRLVDEWFISMDKLRYEIMEVTKKIRWIPDFGLERELDWLRNMDDWMISKKRYWGLALPIYECKQCGSFEVIGSEIELRQRAVEGWEDFSGHTPHRPWVDAVKIECPKCGATVSRIPDVGNPWLDAGIVSYATLNYRHDRTYWEEWFPADWISESFPGQFRNWFYSLLVMSTVMENREPFRSVFTYATLSDEHGKPMHKSSGNMIEFREAAEKMGVDVMRWMYCRCVPEADLKFGYGPGDEVRRQFVLPLWNVYAFFVTYANLDGWQPAEGRPPQSLQPLDRWILAALQDVITTVTTRLEDFDSMNACRRLEGFVDDLSNWYVRRSRRRFWKAEDDADKEAAYGTLYTCLTTLVKLMAPFTPFLSEAMYQNLVRSVSVDDTAPESVHLAAWPQADVSLTDAGLLTEMALLMQVVSLGRAARQKAALKVRQPLAEMLVKLKSPAEREIIAGLRDQILDELNVKALGFVEEDADLVSYVLRPVPSVLGPKYGKRMSAIQAALAAVDARQGARALQRGEALSISLEGESLLLAPDEVKVYANERPGYSVAEDAGYVAAVSTTLTPELRREGLARELVRRLQDMRKSAGLDIADRIHVRYVGGQQVSTVLTEFRASVSQETLAISLETGEGAGYREDHEVDGEKVTFWIAKA